MPSKQNITVNLGTDELVISRYGVSGPGWHLPLDKAEKVFGAALHAVEVLIALQVSGPFDHETPPPSRSAQNAGGIEPSARGGGQDLPPAPHPDCRCGFCRSHTPDDDSLVGVPV